MEIQLEKDAYSFGNNLYFTVLMNCETPKNTMSIYSLRRLSQKAVSFFYLIFC